MRPIRRLLILFVLLAAMFALRGYVVDGRARTGAVHHRDAPNTFFGLIVFGGFRPIFLEHLWSKADALYAQGRYWEVIDVFDRIARLDPGNPRVWSYQGHLIIYGIARKEVDEAMRWRWYRRGVAHLEHGIARNPGDFRLREQLFHVYLHDIAPDARLSRQLRQSTGLDGLGHAMKTAGELRDRFPDVPLAHIYYRRAAEEVAERLLNDGRFQDAARAFDELADLAAVERERDPESTPAAEVANLREWARLVRELDAAVDWETLGDPQGPVVRDAARLDALLARVEELMAPSGPLSFDPEVETLDAAVVSLVHVRILQLCQGFGLAKKPALALRYLEWVNRICDLAEGRLGPRLPYYSAAYVKTLRSFLDTDTRLWQARDEGGDIPEDLRQRWESELDELDRLIRARAGRGDYFERRLREARR